MLKYHFHLFDLAETSLGGRKRKRGKHSDKVKSAPLKSKEKEVGQKEEHAGCMQHVQRVSVEHAAPIISSDIFILLEECKSLNVLGSCLLRDGLALRGPVTVAEDLGFVSRIYMEAHTHLVQESCCPPLASTGQHEHTYMQAKHSFTYNKNK